MQTIELLPRHFFWVLQGLCTLHHKPFALSLAQQQLLAPYTQVSLQKALGDYGFNISWRRCKLVQLHKETFPLLVWQKTEANSADSDDTKKCTPYIILDVDSSQIVLISPDHPKPRHFSVSDFALHYSGHVARISPKAAPAENVDQQALTVQERKFNFRWFIPEFLKHQKLCQEILLASLVIQLMALATSMLTQTIIDKVVVHRTQSTLIVIVIGLLIFMLFSAVLSWLRQYLVLHTGNRVDAVLGAAVFARLLRLSPMYFQQRPTGVTVARLHGVETIREFIASAAVTLVLDLPFLLIFVAIMFYYSVALTLIVLLILSLITALSFIVAPLFKARLHEQFQLGARNQAFLTEYIAGAETVKSLQLEPQLVSRYSEYLASYLQAGFLTRQLSNTYSTIAGLLEQCMSLLILGVGAYTVMQSTQFTIGMLVAFQMFAGRLSQPMLRLVGLWQQFQQASLSVARLGDLMNAPVEPYAMTPVREGRRQGSVDIEQIAFRYSQQQPLIYGNLSLHIPHGQTVAIMGASGCGKSTLAKLLQGFYQPEAGRILIGGVDIRHLSANELRSHFGVVPQDTTLFSGTIYDNLQMANPQASFVQIVAACRMAEIHDVIEALPQAYQTEIGERGAGLSGGQKQRIAIARALLKRPGILIFDEATSALDSMTADQFVRTINKLKGKVTMIFITHGLPRSLLVDIVYRLSADGVEKIMPQASAQREST